MSETGKLIKAARKRAGLTQDALAEKLNIPQTAVSKYETGLRVPKMQTLEKIAAAIGCRIYDLLPVEAWDSLRVSVPGSDFGEVVLRRRGPEKWPDEEDLLKPFRELNNIGARKAVDYVQDLAKVEEYRLKEINVSMPKEEYEKIIFPDPSADKQ